MAISSEEFDKAFVRKWLEAVRTERGAKWIAEELHVSRGYVLNKKQTLMRHGIRLPALRPGRYSINPKHISNLKEIIDEEIQP